MVELFKQKPLDLRPGSEAELEEVLAGSKEVWGSGISLEDYVDYHGLIRNHPWSRENYRHLVLVDEQGQIFSSCKTYDHQVRIDSGQFRLGTIGAIFTPPAFRKMSYASQMLDYLLDEFRGQGFDLAMLFSDIGADFYSRLGFRLFEKRDPIYSFLERGIEQAEIQILNHLPEELLEWDQNYDQRQRFALEKSPSYFQLLSERISWHQKYLGYQDQKAVVCFPDRSYLLADLSRFRITVRRFATAAEDRAFALARILSSLRQKLGFNDFSGWLPEEFAQFSCLKLKAQEPRNRTLLMFLALTRKAEAVYQLRPEEVQFWLADYF